MERPEHSFLPNQLALMWSLEGFFSVSTKVMSFLIWKYQQIGCSMTKYFGDSIAV